ncbi:3'-5' exonuclease [Streptomyces sp. AV19]|uniref:exonuclease domain-containing protein n=1 Tax=Streptomyces sp. AV19 TaxID=2793068 RepID=UPI0018FF0DC2|nr:exonuclease domain-containing protein [Streptomyces sp. AV19]MBH1934270.1 3'-5' exonuclease [Streptomyces sp. AV19]MDG4533420.1 exonuclease domain-containing protein [Streptomyces sp. AV19]
MTTTSWPDGRLIAFDTETTGTDWATDRIVAACVALVGAGREPEIATWLVNPGVEIPQAATAVHGITTDQARADGRDPATVLGEITDWLGLQMDGGWPLVVFNARFDLTLLDRECRRYDLPTLPDRLLSRELAPVIDPLVLDKQVQPYRRGSRQLPDLCAHWQVRHDKQHDPNADAFAAARLAWRIGRTYPHLGAMELDALHALQVERAAQQAASLQAYRRRTDPTAHIEGRWPYVPQTINSPEGKQS